MANTDIGLKRKNVLQGKQSCKPWLMLALSIIESGKSCNDTEFLESNWCKYLMSACCELMDTSTFARPTTHTNIKEDGYN